MIFETYGPSETQFPAFWGLDYKNSEPLPFHEFNYVTMYKGLIELIELFTIYCVI